MSNYYDLLNKTILFRFDENSCLGRMAKALDNPSEMPVAANMLLNNAATNGWSGNLWHVLIANSLLESENPFSILSERRKAARDSFREIALSDMKIFRDLMPAESDNPVWAVIKNFSSGYCASADSRSINLAEEIEKASDAEEFLTALSSYYEKFGCGKYSVASGFRISGSEIIPVKDRKRASFEDLVGYEKQKELLRDNTEKFIRGEGSNNVLLYGDAGTGKSTSIQALLSEYEDDGLRIIEIYKHQFASIPDILSQLKNRNYSFILLLDDLSFEESETEYKYLKAVMEGGSGMAPENVRIYATSNRRHLVRESWKDKNDMEHNDDVHRSETMEEKLSLASRFGLQIFYPSPDFREYQNIVRSLAERSGAGGMNEEELSKAAAAWQISHGNKSGRTAKQFIDSLNKNNQEC